MSESQDITRKAKSNLAIALTCLPKERRQDMVTFYAFCRVIDDLADDLDIPLKDRQIGLDQWRHGLTNGFTNPDELQAETYQLLNKYSISPQPFLDLIDGCASDLEPQRFQTWDELETYTYRVASCVGLISTKIFGCTHSDSEKYAISLGHALQITNILRDIHEDLENGGRIYLPLEDLTRFGLSESDLENHTHDDRFVAMMNYQAERAEAFYQEALSHRQPEDRGALKAAEAMRKIYHALLRKMQEDDFKVYDQRYSVPKWYKVAILLRSLLP